LGGRKFDVGEIVFMPMLRIIIFIAVAKGRHVSNYSRRSLVEHGNSTS
jgi:hypothetical protein